MADFKLRVNGATRNARVEPDTPLLYVLRNDFELNGPRFGCGLAQCGACTVLVEGKPMRSCVTPVSAVAQGPRHDLEGLGTAEKPHPLQKAFIEEQAGQCGYCANGMIMTAKALLDRNPKPTEAQIRKALTANLCRCGTHNRIVRAVQRAAKALRPLSRRRGGAVMSAAGLPPRFLKAGGLVVGFSWRLGSLAQQAARAACPAASTPTACSTAGSASTRTAPSRCSPASASWARASSPRSRRSRPTSSTSPRAHRDGHGDTARTPNEGMTAGSLSVENSGTALRFACAEARQILRLGRGAKLGAPAADLSVSDGTVTRSAARSRTGTSRGDANLKREATAQAKPKPPAQHKLVGKSVPRRDIPKKLTGGAAYVQDVRLPGMVFGRVVRPASSRARLVSFDEAAVEACPAWSRWRGTGASSPSRPSARSRRSRPRGAARRPRDGPRRRVPPPATRSTCN